MNEKFMFLIIIKVHVVVCWRYFVKWCTFTDVLSLSHGGSELWLWNQTLNLIAFANGIPRSFDGKNHFNYVKNQALIVWKLGLQKGMQQSYILLDVIIVYKLGTWVWSCMIVQFLCIFLITFIIRCTQIDLFW